MKLELRNIRNYPRMSEETNAYDAVVYKDGKRLCAVGNRGNGGPDEQRPFPPHTMADIKAVDEWLAANIPPLPSFIEGRPGTPCDLEIWCGRQLERTIATRDLKRRMARAVVYVDGGKCYFSKAPYSGAVPALTQKIKAKYPNAQVLNTMQIDKAVDLYLETAG